YAGRCSGMIGAFEERQPGDDFWRTVRLEQIPPWRAARDRGDQRQIALRFRRRLHLGVRAEMADISHDEAEVKARRIPHRGLADRDVRMHRERRLDVSEGRDDDAPDALDGVERTGARMA